MIKIEIPPKRRSYAMSVTLVASVLFHIVLWAGLTEFGNRPMSESYIVQMMIKDKKLEPPTPEPEKKKVDLKKLEAMATPPPAEETFKQLLEKKTIEQEIKADFKIERNIIDQKITNLNNTFTRSRSDDNFNELPSLVNTGGRGGGDAGPPAKEIRIGSGRKGGIGISSDGAGTIGVSIGSGLGGGRGHGRGSGTGDGPDVPTMRLGGVGFGNGRGGGGGGGGGAVNIGNIGNSDGRAKKQEAAPVVTLAPTKQMQAASTPSVSGEWEQSPIAGPIAGLQVKCYNNPGIHVYGDVRIQCDNNQIVAAWRRM